MAACFCLSLFFFFVSGRGSWKGEDSFCWDVIGEVCQEEEGESTRKIQFLAQNVILMA